MLNSHYEDEEKKDEKETGKLIKKSQTKKGCLLNLEINLFRSKVKGKHSAGKEF